MILRLKLTDFTQDPPEELGEYTDIEKLKLSILNYIESQDGSCVDLRVLQWDEKHNSWIPITAAADAINEFILMYLREYRRSSERVEEIKL